MSGHITLTLHELRRLEEASKDGDMVAGLLMKRGTERGAWVTITKEEAARMWLPRARCL